MKAPVGLFTSHGSLRHIGKVIARAKHHQGRTFRLTGDKFIKKGRDTQASTPNIELF